MNSTVWVETLVAQLRRREFEEVARLTCYFPQTGENRLLRLVALLGSDEFGAADELLSSSEGTLGGIYASIHQWLDAAGLETDRLSRLHWENVSLLGLEGAVTRAKDSIPQLISCLEVALRSERESRARTAFCDALLERILARLPLNDVETLLRLAQVLTGTPSYRKQLVRLLAKAVDTDPARLPDSVALIVTWSRRVSDKRLLNWAHEMLQSREYSAEALARSVLLLLDAGDDRPERHLERLSSPLSMPLVVELTKSLLRKQDSDLRLIKKLFEAAELRPGDFALIDQLAGIDPTGQIAFLVRHGRVLYQLGILTVAPETMGLQIIRSLGPRHADNVARHLIKHCKEVDTALFQIFTITILQTYKALELSTLTLLADAASESPRIFAEPLRSMVQQATVSLIEARKFDNSNAMGKPDDSHILDERSRLLSYEEGEGDAAVPRSGMGRRRPGKTHAPPLVLEKIESSNRIERHTSVDLPCECLLNKAVELTVRLTRSAHQSSRAIQQISLVTSTETDEDVEVDVIVTAPGFAIRPWRRVLRVPIHSDSESVSFTMIPQETGRQAVEVEFLQDASRVGYLIVDTVVRARRGEAARGRLALLEDPVLGLTNPTERSPNQRLFHVTWEARGGRLSYLLQSAHTTEESELPGGDEVKARAEDWLRELNAFLAEVVTRARPSADEWESMLLNLRAIGAQLYQDLVPTSITDRVATWVPGTSLVISTNEQWIPWELMYDGDDFWGKKFLLTRLPRLSGDVQDVMMSPSRPTPESGRLVRRIVNVVGGGVATETQRACHLFSGLSEEVKTEVLLEKPLEVLRKTLPGADAVHFTCHGLTDPHLLQIAKDRSRSQNLAPQSVPFLPLEPGCLVFANACASSVPAVTFGRFTNFGWEFYRRGAEVFIGTLGPIPTSYAIQFAETFYQHLLREEGSAGCSVGEALAAARRDAENRSNLFWLLYCIYGNPDARLLRRGSVSTESKEEA